MSQFFTEAELDGLNEQELRALRGRLLADLQRTGNSAFLSPGIYATLQNITAALLKLQQRTYRPRPRPPQGPRP